MAERADDINAVDENGDTALHRAAEHGSVIRIHQLLRQGANLEARNEDGATPLILAVANEQYDAIERLLEGGADIHARDHKGDTPLHYSAGASDPSLTSLFLQAGAHPESRNSNGATPIHAIVEHPTHIEPGEDSIETVDVLMRAGSDLNAQDKDGNTALHYLADGRIGGGRQLTEALLERSARTDIKNRQGLTSLETTSPEDSAVKRINSRLVRDAIQQYQERQQSPEVAGREPPSPSHSAFPDGNTDLHDAAANGHLERTIALLREGADPNLPDEHGNTPLHNSAYVNATEITERLLDAQADPNAVNRDGNTPLHVAIHFSGEGSYDATIERLLNAGTDLNLRNSLDGYTPLHTAVREGFHGTAAELLRRGAGPNVQDNEGQTPLHTASRLETSHCADTMLRANADPNIADRNGNTPMHIAALSNSAEVIDTLVEAKAHQDMRNAEGRTPLSLADESQAHEVVARLEKAGAVRDNLDSIAKTGISLPDLEQADRLSDASPLHIVAAAGDLNKVDHLLNHGANPNELDANHRTPLHEAVDAGSLKTVDRLLQADANPDRQDAYLGHSALHRAVQAQSQPIAERLLKSGANPNLPDVEGDTPLHAALKDTLHKDKQLAVVNTLIAHGADRNFADRGTGSTPLHLAVSGDNFKALGRLIEEKADPNVPDISGHTPLHLAASRSSAMTQQLLVAGAVPDVNNAQGHTPLHAAALSAHTDSAERLLDAGADPNSRTEQQQTPMHFAAHSQSPETVDRLAAAGGDPNARDIHGATPLHSAALQDSPRTVNRLLAAGADPTARGENNLGTPRELAQHHGCSAAADHLARAETARNSAKQRSPSRVQRFINRFKTVDQDIPDKTANGSRGKTNASIKQHPRNHHKEKTMPEPHWTHNKSARQFTEQVAERVAKQVEQGKASFQKGYDKPKSADMQPFNPATLKRFKGLNAIQLRSVAQEKGYSDPRWMSFQAANKIGAKIRKGEKGTRVESLKFAPRSETRSSSGSGETDKKQEQPKVSHQTYVVFNAEQIERMPALEKQLPAEPQQHEICERAERLIQDSGVKIEHPDSGQPYTLYDKQKDAVVVPEMESCKSPESFYGHAVRGMTDRAADQQQQNRTGPQSEAQQQQASSRLEMRREMACQTISSKLHLPKQPTGERNKAQWAQTIRNSPNELRFAARDADRIADKVLEHDRPQQRQQAAPSREAVAAPATPERMQEAQRSLQQQPQRDMAEAMSR